LYQHQKPKLKNQQLKLKKNQKPNEQQKLQQKTEDRIDV
jgi:hypothetical protein